MLSRFGLVIRTRNNKTKKRIILDLKESLISALSGRTNRVVLPRLTDHILALLEELDIIYDEDSAEVDDLPDLIEDDDDDDDDDSFDVEQFILDFCEAFWQVPLRPDERRYFVGKIKNIVLSYRRAAQGSRNGPLAWASVVSLPVRMVQAIFRTSCLAPRNTQTASKIERRREPGLKMQTYVDDPAMALRGSKTQRDESIATVILLWSSLGFDLSYAKASRGRAVSWIGSDIRIGRTWIKASIKDERVKELA